MSKQEQNKNKHWWQNICLKPWQIIIFLIVTSLLASFVMLRVTTEHKEEVIPMMLENDSVIVWNVLPAFLMSGFMYFLTSRMIFSAILVNGIWALLAITDAMKVDMRQEPLLPTDFLLVKEALTIVKTFPSTLLLILAVSVIIVVLVLLFCFLKLKETKLPIHTRVMGVNIMIVCGIICNQYIYANTELYDSYAVYENPYFQVNQYNSRGLAYSFWYQVNAIQIQTPSEYKAEAYEAFFDMPIEYTHAQKPHIIMIMGEAYSDLSENEHISFEGYTNPMAQFQALCEEKNAVSGHIVVPNFGGGTSNTEYDVLTGLSSGLLDTALPAYNFIHHDIDALPYRLGLLGYDTVSIHPGYAWFYNRQNVYPDLGFDDTYFLEDTFDMKTQGTASGYISEEATMDEIISILDTHIQTESTPLFSFTVTIQNHGPYEKKYGSIAQNFDTDIALTDVEIDLLSQYFYGMTDADLQLERLITYAKQSTEPIVVVYFGDHLPGFTNGMDFFDILDYPIDANGTPEEQLAVYETPYVIWANDKAAELCDFETQKQKANLPENGIISSFYLGALLTELLDMEHISPLYDQLNTLRKQYPVISELYQVDADGMYTQELPEEAQGQMEHLKRWQYYILFDRQITTQTK